MAEYQGLGLFVFLGVAAVGLLLVLTTILGPKLRFAEKQEPFECGEHQLVSPYQRFNIKFYLVAVSFLIFDVEIVFLYPWAVVFKGLGWYGYVGMLIFLFVLSVGLAYEWLKGGLDWN